MQYLKTYEIFESDEKKSTGDRLTLSPYQYQQLSDYINNEVEENPERIEDLLWAWDLTWFTPSEFVKKIYQARERGM
jgi:hypothetical protein